VGEIKTESALAAERMKQYILKHLHEAITAKDVAAAAGYSQYHAARVFKGETGVSPLDRKSVV
jgi:AraC-like DNA-binding protein